MNERDRVAHLDEMLSQALHGETRDERIVRRAGVVAFWCFTVGVMLLTFAFGIMALEAGWY